MEGLVRAYIPLRAALLSLPFAAAAATAFASGFSGTYTISYLSGPSHTLTAQQCLTFTQTSNVLGFPNSGTWNSSTFSGWGGNFIVDGTDMRFYGTFGGGTGVTNHYASLKNGVLNGKGFDDWAVSAPPITASNDGKIKFKLGCSLARSETLSGSGSPTH
jgi:hypothetical protein